MLRNKKPRKRRLPTAEEFLTFIPIRGDFEWKENAEGLVEIKIPKFRSNFGKSFCKIIKKDDIIIAKMDQYGSIVWNNCDGKKTVNDILKIMKKEFPKTENLEQRLFLFLQQMQSLNYLSFI